LRRSARNAGADTGVDCAVREGRDGAVRPARGDEEFDRVAADIDDGNGDGDGDVGIFNLGWTRMNPDCGARKG